MSKAAGPANNATLDKAIALHQQGHLQRADKLYSKILARKPADGDALHMRGVLKLEQGNHELAEHLLKKALKSTSTDPWIHFHFAQVLAATERHEQATDAFEKALNLGANESDVYFMYANSLFELSRLPEAIDYYQRSLNLQPHDQDCQLNLVNAYEAAGEFDKALDILEPLALTKNANIHLKLQFSELLVNTKQARKAHEVILTIESPVSIEYVDHILSSARYMHKNVRHNSSEYLLDLIAQHFESLSPRQHDLTVGLLNNLGKYADSRALIIKADKQTRSGWSWFQQGLCDQVAGNFTDAANCHTKALEIDENQGAAAYSLASNGNTEVGDTLLERWSKKIDDPNTPAEQRPNFAFAAARALDNRKELARAFDCYEKANQLTAELQPFNADRWDDYIDDVIDTFSADFFQKRQDYFESDVLSDEQSGQNLSFIVGMPRSGSTLLEQTLKQRAGMRGLGEHHAMHRIVADMPEITQFKRDTPMCALELGPSHIKDFRDQYLESIIKQQAFLSPQALNERSLAGPFVDKMLGNYYRLGIIALMFPKARILHSARDPMATGVSCFTNVFNGGLKFTYDLFTMGRVWQAYDRLMKHWHEVLPIAIMDVHYEKMVSDTDTYFPTVLNFLNIDDVNAADSNSSDNEDQGNIATASFWQARQAISTGSVESWKRFDAHLDPLREGLNYNRRKL